MNNTVFALVSRCSPRHAPVLLSFLVVQSRHDPRFIVELCVLLLNILSALALIAFPRTRCLDQGPVSRIITRPKMVVE